MAFKMNPSSPLLRKTGNFESPMKRMGDPKDFKVKPVASVEAGNEGGMIPGSSGDLLTKDQKSVQKDLYKFNKQSIRENKKSKLKEIRQSNMHHEDKKDARKIVRKTNRVNKSLNKIAYDINKSGDYGTKSDKYNAMEGTGGSRAGNILRDIVGTRAKDAGRKTTAGKVIMTIRANQGKRRFERKKKVASGGGSQVGDALRRLKKNVTEIVVGSKEAGTSVGSKKWDGNTDHLNYRKNSPARKKADIKIKPANKGKFTSWAKSNGFASPMAAANAVMKNKDKYSAAVVKMANFAKNFGK